MKIEDSVVVRKALGGAFSRDGTYFIFAVLLEQEVLKDKMKKQ